MKFNFVKKFVMLAVLSVMIFLQSCHKNSDQAAQVPVGAAGFFVVNEGGFGNGNASLSFYDRKTDIVTNNVFTSKNGRPLGDQAQSMTIFQNKGYIVVQNSAKVEVINADDFSSVETITGLPSPRYFLGISDTKAYVSDWGANGLNGTIKVIDLLANKVTNTIATGVGPNQMLKINNLVYVVNSGGFDFGSNTSIKDNNVRVIDSNTDAVIATIKTGDNPNSLQRDKDGSIWVLSGGLQVYTPDFSALDLTKSTKGSLSKLSASNTEALRLSMDIVFDGPSNLQISPDGTKLYYTYNNAIYSVSTSATTLPTTPFKAKDYYGLAVDPFNGNIIGCNAGNFSSAGTTDVYNPAGNLLKTYTVGIAPNGCTFK